MRVLVTGANGFIGHAVLKQLNSIGGIQAVGSVRSANRVENTTVVAVGDLTAQTDWSVALAGVNYIVHLAACAHVMNNSKAYPLAVFREVNVESTLNLARQAVVAGVKRFVFISSVKVNGEITEPGKAFTENDSPNPQDSYSLSKHEAEQALRRFCADSLTELVVIRSPLVYGPGVKANFAALMRAVKLGKYLPLGSVQNQRSLVALDNLVDFIFTCITHPLAANQTFFVSDGKDVSTTELVLGMAHAAGVPANLLPVPLWALQVGAMLLGKGDAVLRLCGNLQVDISKARSFLGWVPPVSVEEGLRRAIGYEKSF